MLDSDLAVGLGFFDKSIDLIYVGNQKQDRFVLFPAFEFFELANCGGVQRVSSEAVKRVGAKRDYAAVSDQAGGFFVSR